MQQLPENNIDFEEESKALVPTGALMPGQVGVQVYVPPPLPEIKLDFQTIRETIAPPNASDAEVKTFIQIAEHNGLDPFKRDIYLTKMGTGDKAKVAYITGYMVGVKRAMRTGLVTGWNCVVDDIKNPTMATLTIHRRDWKDPFEWIVLFDEVAYVQKKEYKNNQPTGKYIKTIRPMYQQQPVFQVIKTCIGQGFRLCFPIEAGGLPYDKDELPYLDEEEPISIEPTQSVQEQQGSPENKQQTQENQENQENQEKKKISEQPPTELSPEDGERYRKATFDLMKFRGVEEDTWKLVCYAMFNVDSRSAMQPAQWKQFFDVQHKQMDDVDQARYENRLQLYKAFKPFEKIEGLDLARLEQYLKFRFIWPVLYNSQDITPLLEFLKKAQKPNNTPMLLQGIKNMQQWFEDIGGEDEPFLMLETVHNTRMAADDPGMGATFLQAFFSSMMVEPKKGLCFLTDITPVTFKAWPEAVKIAAASAGIEYEKQPGDETDEGEEDEEIDAENDVPF